MLGAIIGDIVGSRFEWNNIKTKDFELFTEKCQLTDDSIMTLALAEAIMDCQKDYSLLSQNAIIRMQQWGRAYPHAGYGGNFLGWLFSDNPQPYNSFGNGAAMRVSACGFIATTLEEVKQYSKAVTEVTHNHPEGIKGAEATAVVIFLARQGKSRSEIRDYMNANYYTLDFTLDDIRDSYDFDVTCQGTVPQAIECFLESTSFEDCIRNAISIGGDSDTMAAIAGGMAEAYYGIPDNIKKKAVTYFDEMQLGVLNTFYKWTKGAEVAKPRKKTGRKTKEKPMADKNTANVGFEEKLWLAADKLRSNMDAAEYKHVVLGLIFLKYVSDSFSEKYEQLKAEGYGDEEDRDEYLAENIFWVPKEARWEVIRAHATNPDIGSVIDNAMDAIEKENNALKGVLTKNYARQELDKTKLGELVTLFTNIEVGSTAAQERDVLGRVYEYFLSKFASAEGKLGGEFYTPSCIVRTLVEMIEPFSGQIFDPACGSGGMFCQSARFVKEHQGNIRDISIFGQESNPTTWKLAKMNLAIRGLEANLGQYNADSFHDDQHKNLKANFILANPPFNISDWGGERLREDIRWKYGVPPVGNANYAWLQHMLHHLNPVGGVAGTVLANGSLSTATGGEGEIRKNMIEGDVVECIVTMPGQLFYSTGIPVSLWIMRKGKNANTQGKILFIDARNMGTMVTRKLRELTEEDIQKIASTYQNWRQGNEYEDVQGFCKVATLDEVAEQDFILTPGRYVGIEEQEDDGEPFEEKMTRLTTELYGLFEESHRLETDIRKKLAAIGFGE